ncbi:MAG: hypothetical protein J2O47_10185, partial [Acidimicrobiaceae bacterium]|nr:hypothetical protein [Acidimicrobiaceae bacterium]
EVFTEAGIPSGPVNDIAGGVELAASLGLDPVVLSGDVPVVRNPLRFSATPVRYDLAPPELDEHGDEIRAWLGVPKKGHDRSPETGRAAQTERHTS